MRLTNVLMYYIRRKHIPGKIDIGKNRVVRFVKCHGKRSAMTQMVLEQKNLDILNKPYISEEEDYNHEADMGLENQQREAKKIAKIEERWLPNRYMEDYYVILEKSKKWE